MNNEINHTEKPQGEIISQGRKITLKKLIGIGILIIGLQIPVLEISTLLNEREHAGAITDTNQKELLKLPQSQIYAEPVIVLEEPVPTSTSAMLAPLPETIKCAQDIAKKNRGKLNTIRFDKMKNDINIEIVEQKRGIHTYKNYIATIKFNGNLNFKNLSPKLKELNWSKADLVFYFENSCNKSNCVALKDLKIETKSANYNTNMRDGGLYTINKSLSISETLKMNPDLNNDELKISGTIILKGVNSFNIQNSAISSENTLKTPIKSLKIEDLNFNVNKSTAKPDDIYTWTIDDSNLSDITTQSIWQLNESKNILSFSLPSFIDDYRMVTRSLKYELMVFALIFLAFLVFEWIIMLPIHPIQYGMIGLSICLYYLLLLSFSEKIGFTNAYFISSLTTTLIISGYSSAILKLWRHGGLIFGLMSITFSYLYVLLSMEQNALVVGTVGLTLILSLIMYITREIDWYKLGEIK